MTISAIISLYSLWCMLIVFCQNCVFSQSLCSEPRPSHCISEKVGDANLPCALSTSVSIDCSYSVLNVSNMGQIPTVPPCSIDIPGMAEKVNWSVYYFHGPSDSHCYLGLNLTWKLPSYGSAKFVTGFLLNFTYLNYGLTVSRRFDINYKQNVEQLYKTVFFYDCFMPIAGQPFRVALQTLPMSHLGRPDSNNVIKLGSLPVSVELTQSTHCDALSWQPQVTVKSSELDSRIEVTFDPAPECCSYKGYNISLVDYHSDALMTIYQRQTKYPTFGEKIYVDFTNVCPNIYLLAIVPFMNKTCQCLVRDENSAVDAICQPCSATEISPLYMNRSKCQPDDVDNDECPPVASTSTSAPTIGTGQVIGAVVGSFVALILLLLLLCFVIWWRRRLQEEPLKVQRKQKIVLASLGGSKVLQDVLTSFAKFLESQVHCFVVQDELCTSTPPSGSSSPLADRFRDLLVDTDHLILVHSERSSRVSPQSTTNNNNNNSNKTTPTDYVSVVAVLLADCMSRMPRRCAVYNVFFKPSPHCCVSESVQSLCGGRVYELMEDINLLLVHIDGPTGVRADNYTHSSEGQKLSIDVMALRRDRDSGTFSRSSSDSSLSRMSVDPSFPPLTHGMSLSSPDLESASLQVNKIESFLRAINSEYDRSCGLDVASSYASSGLRIPGQLCRNDSERSSIGISASVA